MSYTNGLDKPSDYFNTVLYTGTGSELSISSLDFSPDWVWVKQRGADASHFLYDSVRGATKSIRSNSTNAEATVSESLKSFDSNGFTLGTSAEPNTSSGTYVGWSWRGSDSSASSNTDGSITSTVSANTTAGFSIVTWTAGSGVGSIGHGLGVAPSMIIVKGRSSAIGWVTGLKSNGWNNYLQLQSTNANTNDQRMFSPSGQSDPTSTVWYQDHAALGSSGDTMVGYVFADTGNKFFKTGKYTGNGSASGPYIYTGHKPAAIIIKRTDVAKNWYINDNLREGYNNDNPYISPNLSVAETGGTEIDILSNGFRITAGGTGHNQSGGTYIYASIAENPFVTSSGVPACAR